MTTGPKVLLCSTKILTTASQSILIEFRAISTVTGVLTIRELAALPTESHGTVLFLCKI